MNKTKKNGILAIAGLFVLMMTAASVSANDEDEPGVLDRIDIETDTTPENDMDDSTSTEEEPNLISPSTDADGESLIIAPGGDIEQEDSSSKDNTFTTGLILTIGISGIVGLGAALLIFRNKN